MEETREDKIAKLQAKRAEKEELTQQEIKISRELIAEVEKEEIPVQ